MENLTTVLVSGVTDIRLTLGNNATIISFPAWTIHYISDYVGRICRLEPGLQAQLNKCVENREHRDITLATSRIEGVLPDLVVRTFMEKLTSGWILKHVWLVSFAYIVA
jgi:hypothetical protein